MKTRSLPPAAISRRRISDPSSQSRPLVSRVCGPSFRSAFGFEDGGDHGALGPGADDVGGSFVAEKKSEGVDQNGFAGSSFAGEQVEAGGELHGHVVDDGVVFEPQFSEHGPS